MSAEASHPTSGASETGDSSRERTNVPVWIIILLLLLLYWGMVYFDQRGAWFSPEVYLPYQSLEQLQAYQPASGDRMIIDEGRRSFELYCALCHNSDGMGKPNQAPPLASSEWVQSSPAQLIRIPLYGLTGSVTVKGQVMNFPAPMPPIGAALSPEQLAAVLSYVRQAWGNKGSLIAPEQVKAVHAQVGNRAQPFTPEEIQQVPEK